jgi:hypothetical protein
MAGEAAVVGPAELAVAGYWVDQAAAANTALAERAATQITALWMAFSSWYSAKELEEMAAQCADLSRTAQEMAFGTMVEYIAQVTSLSRGATSLHIPNVRLAPIRKGVPLERVYERPAKAYRTAVAKGKTPEQARKAAYERALGLVDMDLALARRDGSIGALKALRVQRYRRVIRPELSKTGTCLLCLAASLQTYSIKELLPIHDRCKCLVMPIIDGKDPGEQFNEADREAVYRAAGVTGQQELSNLRVKVHEHGELGPILTVAGHKFTGPEQIRRRKGKEAADFSAALSAHGTTLPTNDIFEKLAAAGAIPNNPSGGWGFGGGGGNGGRFTDAAEPPDEYPATNSGTPPPFRPSERPAVSVGSRNHILQRHRHDGSGRTVFPASWNDADIISAVEATMARPDAVKHFGDQFIFERAMDGETVHVAVRVDKPRPFVWTAYPLPKE